LNFRERQVIAAVVRKNEIADKFRLIGDYFTDPSCRRIFEAGAIRLERGAPFDEHAIAPDLEPIVRSDLLAMMEELAGDFGLIGTYVSGLRAEYLKRGARAIGESLAAATGSSEEPEAIIDAAQSRLDELQEGRGSARTCRAGDAAARVEKAAIEAKCCGVPPGIKTGIDALDEILQPMRGGQLIVVAGGTSSGKTSLATNIAMNVARMATPAALFTLEMSADDIGVRLLASETGISTADILSGRLSQDEQSRIREATEEVDAWPLYIERCNALDAGQLLRGGRQLRRKYGVGLVIVDYLQLMRGRGRSFYEQVSEVTRGLKIASGELDLPIIALSQLNREMERRVDGVKIEDRHLKRRPKLSDLRDSGSIEQDADVVLLLHREEVHLARERPPLQDLDNYQEWSRAMDRHRGKADLILAKQRQGKTGVATCSYDEIRFKFGGLADG
jgi:replicative DNA helicase